MKAVYSMVHEKEAVHLIKNHLKLEELNIPLELRTICNTGNYEEELTKFYQTLNNVLIIEPHSSISNINNDYLLYFSGLDQQIIEKSKVLFNGKGTIVKDDQDIKRVIFEIILKPEENIEKIINYIEPLKTLTNSLFAMFNQY